jgi:tRNA(adenine34) deaminase
MCAGAIISARIPTLVYGAKEPLTGSCGSVIDLFFERYGHRPQVFPGVLEADCAALLRAFFRDKR